MKDRLQKSEDDYSYAEGPDIRASILVDYEKIIREAEQRAGALFDLRPKAPVVVHRIPEYAERNAAANYSPPARDGSKPGVSTFRWLARSSRASACGQPPTMRRFPGITSSLLFNRKIRTFPASGPTG